MRLLRWIRKKLKQLLTGGCEYAPVATEPRVEKPAAESYFDFGQ